MNKIIFTQNDVPERKSKGWPQMSTDVIIKFPTGDIEIAHHHVTGGWQFPDDYTLSLKPDDDRLKQRFQWMYFPDREPDHPDFNDFLKHVAAMGGDSDFSQVNYWVHTYLEFLESDLKICPHCGIMTDRGGDDSKCYAAPPNAIPNPEVLSSTQIKLDRSTLPKDGRRVSFFVNNETKQGIFCSEDNLFWVKTTEWYLASQVDHWKYLKAKK